MIKCTGRMKIGFIRELKQTPKTCVIGGFLYDKDEHDQVNIGFTAWGAVAEAISQFAQKGYILVFHDAKLKNTNQYDKEKTEENKEREIVLQTFSLDEIQAYDEQTKRYATVWTSAVVNVMDEPKTTYEKKEIVSEKKIEKVEKITLLDDDFPFI